MANKYATIKKRREEARQPKLPEMEPDVEGILMAIRSGPKTQTREEIEAKRKPTEKRSKVTLTEEHVWRLNHAPRKPNQIQANRETAGSFSKLRATDESERTKEVAKIAEELSKPETQDETISRLRERVLELLKLRSDELVSQGNGGSFTLPVGRELLGLVQAGAKIAGRGLLICTDIESMRQILDRTPLNSILHVGTRAALLEIENNGTENEREWAKTQQKARIGEQIERYTTLISTETEDMREERVKEEKRRKIRKEIRRELRCGNGADRTEIVEKLEELEKLLPNWADQIAQDDLSLLGIIARDEKLGPAKDKAREMLDGRRISYELKKADTPEKVKEAPKPVAEAPRKDWWPGFNWGDFGRQ